MAKFNSGLLILLAALFIQGCTKKRTYFPEDMENDVHVNIIRFDEALLNIKKETALEDVRALYDQYASFMPYFTESILNIAFDDSLYLADAWPEFLNDTVYGFKETNAEVARQYRDISGIQNQLDCAFSRIHYLYDSLPIPDIWLFVSGFMTPILFTDSNDIAIGVDMYLGCDWKYYNKVVYDYQKKTMRKESIPIDIVSAYLFMHLPYTSTQNRLLEQMIYRGKIMYLLAQIMDDYPYHEIMGYTQKEWEWCEDNEQAIWNTLLEKKDLYKADSKVISSYLNDGPFTLEISQKSPGRLGTWVGWRIVESYMNENEDVTLQELIANTNAQQILSDSKYKP